MNVTQEENICKFSNLIEFKRREALFKKKKKEALRERITNIKDLITPKTPTAKAWKVIKAIRGTHLPELIYQKLEIT